LIDFKKELEVAGDKFKVELKARIASSVPPPNAPSTIKRKGHGRTLINSGDYLESIEFKATENSLEVGVFDPDIAKYVRWNEDGTKKIPPRPVFGPVADGPGETIIDELEKDIADKLLDDITS
jgi:hypothetical protein